MITAATRDETGCHVPVAPAERPADHQQRPGEAQGPDGLDQLPLECVAARHADRDPGCESETCAHRDACGPREARPRNRGPARRPAPATTRRARTSPGARGSRTSRPASRRRRVRRRAGPGAAQRPADRCVSGLRSMGRKGQRGRGPNERSVVSLSQRRFSYPRRPAAAQTFGWMRQAGKCRGVGPVLPAGAAHTRAEPMRLRLRPSSSRCPAKSSRSSSAREWSASSCSTCARIAPRFGRSSAGRRPGEEDRRRGRAPRYRGAGDADQAGERRRGSLVKIGDRSGRALRRPSGGGCSSRRSSWSARVGGATARARSSPDRTLTDEVARHGDETAPVQGRGTARRVPGERRGGVRVPCLLGLARCGRGSHLGHVRAGPAVMGQLRPVAIERPRVGARDRPASAHRPLPPPESPSRALARRASA